MKVTQFVFKVPDRQGTGLKITVVYFDHRVVRIAVKYALYRDLKIRAVVLPQIKRFLILLTLYGLTACGNCRHIALVSNTQIYVFAGQSNNAGFAAWTYDSPDNRIRMFKNGVWSIAVEPTNATGATYGNSVSFAKEMLRLNPSTPIGIVNCAVGSTIIDAWEIDGVPAYTQQGIRDLAPNGLMQNCYDMVEDARRLDPTAQVAGLVFAQGESDANVCEANSPWASTFVSMIAKFRQHYNVPVVYAQLGPLIPESPQFNNEAYSESFRQTQASVKLPSVAIVATKDLSVDSGGVHFDTMSQQTLGQRFARAMYTLTEKASGGGCSDPWWVQLLNKI